MSFDLTIVLTGLIGLVDNTSSSRARMCALLVTSLSNQLENRPMDQSVRSGSSPGFRWIHATSVRRIWHHQLRPFDARASAYARTLEHDGALPEVRGVQQADVAREIDLAMDPDVSLMALWISSPDVDQYIPLGGFASPGPEHFAPISKEQLLARLPEQPVSGLSLEAPADRRPDLQHLE